MVGCTRNEVLGRSPTEDYSSLRRLKFRGPMGSRCKAPFVTQTMNRMAESFGRSKVPWAKLMRLNCTHMLTSKTNKQLSPTSCPHNALYNPTMIYSSCSNNQNAYQTIEPPKSPLQQETGKSHLDPKLMQFEVSNWWPDRLILYLNMAFDRGLVVLHTTPSMFLPCVVSSRGVLGGSRVEV